MMGASIAPKGIRSGWIAALSPSLRRRQVTPMRETDTAALIGQPIIGDPGSLICALANGNNGADPIVFLGGIHVKGILGGKSHNLTTRYSDLGSYPIYPNRPINAAKGEGRWRLVDGYPSGIYEYSWIAGTDSKAMNAIAFTWENVLYIVAECQNMNDLKFGIEILDTNGGMDCTGGYETYEGKGYIQVRENTSGWYLVGASSPMNEYQVEPGTINVSVALDESHNSVANSRCTIAMGADGMGNRGRVIWAFSVAETMETARTAVLAGLTGWQTALAAAEAWWSGFFAGVGDSWKVDDDLRLKGYLALQQIAAQCYDGFLTAGSPNWYGNFLRDTGWVVKALSAQKPSLAKQLLDWFATCPIPSGTNSYTVDKAANSGNNTDNAASWLIGLGEYYARTRDITTASTLKTFADVLLGYAQANYVSSDGHITALSNHDYWDDYVPTEIDHSLVKYESMIDVLWAHALTLMSPVYTALGDSARASFCTDTATVLKAHLEDYRRTDGGLEYAIKTDGSKYASVITLPGSLYAAWLLDDDLCKDFLRTSYPTLGLLQSSILYGLGHSLTDDGAHSQKATVWGPHIPLVALVAAQRFGDYSIAKIVTASFPMGAFPEYVASSFPVLMYGSHAPSFSWSHASILELVQGLSELR